ncbi:unnamed protein product [Trichogramma brassicae]|uniref:Uncharacterized protein n=1 Tax=Trichogramma brassicae TaxID=86971 RepID=A0A6H5I3R7_9HYME|nr:unnamed protein product [Trichogramma brassicae]
MRNDAAAAARAGTLLAHSTFDGRELRFNDARVQELRSNLANQNLYTVSKNISAKFPLRYLWKINCIGVNPSTLAKLGSAPLLNSNWTAFLFWNATAKCNGVLPNLFLTLIGTVCWLSSMMPKNNSIESLSSSLLDIKCRNVSPTSLAEFGFAPLRRSDSIATSLPKREAKCNVFLIRDQWSTRTSRKTIFKKLVREELCYALYCHITIGSNGCWCIPSAASAAVAAMYTRTLAERLQRANRATTASHVQFTTDCTVWKLTRARRHSCYCWTRPLVGHVLLDFFILKALISLTERALSRTQNVTTRVLYSLVHEQQQHQQLRRCTPSSVTYINICCVYSSSETTTTTTRGAHEPILLSAVKENSVQSFHREFSGTSPSSRIRVRSCSKRNIPNSLSSNLWSALSALSCTNPRKSLPGTVSASLFFPHLAAHPDVRTHSQIGQSIE